MNAISISKSLSLSSLNNLGELAKRYITGLSARERVLLIAAIIVVVVLAISSIVPAISQAFSKQSADIEAFNKQMSLVVESLGRYSKLEARRKEIEDAYREVEISEGILTYLEQLIKSKAGIEQGHSINPRETRPFGNKFEQASVTVKFTIVDLKRLVQFLEELVHGSKPFILGRLEIKRRPAGDSLEVELDVSSIREKKPV